MSNRSLRKFAEEVQQSMSNRFSKPVAFNRANADDQKRLEWVKDKNFSGYIKRLIDEDMKKHEKPFDPPNDVIKINVGGLQYKF